MNKIITKKTKQSYDLKHTIKLSKFNVICEEKYVDDKLETQSFRLSKPTHNGYEPKTMRFYYFGGAIDWESQDYDGLYKLEKTLYDKIVLIDDLKSFDDFDNLYCDFLGMDGNVYRLTDDRPLLTVKRLELWASHYDLNKVKNKLSGQKRVVDMFTKEPHWSNRPIVGSEEMYVDIKPTHKLMEKITNQYSFERNDLIAEFLGISKFKIERSECTEEDEDEGW